MAVKDGLPATDFSRMNREYIKAVAEGGSGGGGLPEITEADEGKFLGVVSGEAAWATDPYPGWDVVIVYDCSSNEVRTAELVKGSFEEFVTKAAPIYDPIEEYYINSTPVPVLLMTVADGNISTTVFNYYFDGDSETVYSVVFNFKWYDYSGDFVNSYNDLIRFTSAGIQVEED